MAVIASRLPPWSWATPVAALALAAAQLGGWLPESLMTLALAGVLLVGTVFAAVHHAEIVALKVGEPFGSIVLAIAVTIIEVALIVSIMMTAGQGSDTLARDTVYSTVMIVCCGIVGLCLVVGGARYGEQAFQAHGAASALSVLGTLAVMTLVLPNYLLKVPGPFFSTLQLVVVGLLSLLLYAMFLFVQTVRHRDYFLPAPGQGATADAHATPPPNRTALVSLVLLLVALGGVVLLAKTLAPTLERAVAAAGLPSVFVGVVIAAIVLLPEGIAAVLAARADRLQISLNLALGSALATIGMTIPIVGLASLILRQPLVLGLGPTESLLLMLTLFVSTITLATGRTTILQGTVHLVIFGVFLLAAVVP